MNSNESETGMTERTYTREDMARAWDYGRSKGREEAALEADFGVIRTVWNPYRDQEEA